LIPFNYLIFFSLTFPASTSCLYRKLAASSLATCSRRSLCLTLSSCQGPGLAGIRGKGSGRGQKFGNAGDASEEEERERDGQKEEFKKV
jgi:hypothetical protein